jgi:hypothetical protein
MLFYVFLYSKVISSLIVVLVLYFGCYRSRVLQIIGATNNLHRRSGSVLPPPPDDPRPMPSVTKVVSTSPLDVSINEHHFCGKLVYCGWFDSSVLLVCWQRIELMFLLNSLVRYHLEILTRLKGPVQAMELPIQQHFLQWTLGNEFMNVWYSCINLFCMAGPTSFKP